MNQDSINSFNTHLLELPASLQPGVSVVFSEIKNSLLDPSPADSDWLTALPRVLCSSSFIVSLIRRKPAYINQLIDSGELFRPLDTHRIFSVVSSALSSTEDEQEIMQTLRYTRNQAMLQISFRDLAGWANLDEVLLSLSNTAIALLDATLSQTYNILTARYGEPIGDESGEVQKLIVIAMGKLGGAELNFSSDVDLIFCFPENGQCTGNKSLSNQEFFSRQAKLFIKLLTTQTAEGFVYRVDTRLRPNGDSGALCLSFSAMETYYQLHGRDWERYAFIKAHVVAGDLKKGQELLAELRPFVYRKYLDFSAIESIRDMKELIERQLQRKHEELRNIKLGAGGIREVEFIAQAHQLIRGGRDPELQQQSLLPVLKLLFDRSLLSTDEYTTLTKGYYYLRRCENRLQMFADQQTHNLPLDSGQQIILAMSMCETDWTTFSDQLKQHMLAIHDIFHALFISTTDPEANPNTRALANLWQNELGKEDACQVLLYNNYSDPDTLYSRLQSFRNGSLYRSLSTTARARLDNLLPVMLFEIGDQTNNRVDDINIDTNEIIYRCLDLITAIVRRPVYLSLLLDNEGIRHSLIKLMAASPYASVLIQRYPILLDDLLCGNALEDFAPEILSPELDKQLSVTTDDDLEQQMGLLREFNHSKVLALVSLNISSQLTAIETGRSLSAIAETCTRKSLEISVHGVIARHGRLNIEDETDAKFCVIAYGKLGSFELGFGSDLDLVFVSAGQLDSVKTCGPKKIFAAQFFARIGQRLVHILSTRTPAGRLYEIDMRLRPSGESGPLVTSINRLQHYLKEKAWTWEHQALVRARVVAGDPGLAEAFYSLRKDVLCLRRDEAKLKKDVVDMREKMRASKKTTTGELFDLKQGHGGIVDIEFMVQYMVLRWASEFPQLIRQTETVALLGELNELKLLDNKTHRILTDAFTSWLEKSYRLKLNGLSATISAEDANTLPRQVTEIWNTLLSK